MIPIVLAKTQYGCNILGKLVFLCFYFGGLDFRHLYIEQGTGQITFIIHHLPTPSQVHDLLIIVLSWLQNCAGVRFPVFERPSFPLPHLEGHWLILARESLSFIDEALKIPDLTIHPTQQNGDFYLMEKTFSPNALLLLKQTESTSVAST
jgi:hypothetical protein